MMSMRLNIRKNLKKVLKLLERRLGLVILIIFVIVILYAAFIFYDFAYRPTVISPEVSFERVEIEKTVFERVAERLESREKNILEAMEKEHKDVFK